MNAFWLISAAILTLTVQGQEAPRVQRLSSVVAALEQRLDQPDRIQGRPFPIITGPNNRHSKVGIIGAGPSGLHMAYELKRRGFTDVTILEATDRVGGKSNSVEFQGVSNTLSTLLVDLRSYNGSVIPLFKKFNLFNNIVKFDLEYQLTNNMDSAAPDGLGLMLRQGFTLRRLLKEAAEYVDLHRKLFGKYEGELMPKPCRETMKFVSGSFEDFMVRNDMAALGFILDMANKAAGYSPGHSLSALQAMMWYSPDYVVSGILKKDVYAVMPDKGFHSLWEAMIEDQKLEIVYDFRVDKVQKSGPSWSVFSRGREKKYDFIIWSGLTRDFAQLPNVRSIISDPRDWNVLAESKPIHVGAHVATMRNDVRRGISLAYVENLDENPWRNNVGFTFDAYARFNGIPEDDYETRNYDIQGRKADLRAICVFQYGSDDDDAIPSQSELRRTAKEFFEVGFNATDVEFLTSVRHEYFPHWTVEQVDQGYHWDLFDMQGKYGLWFIGGGASWDSTKSVMEYNLLLLRQTNYDS